MLVSRYKNGVYYWLLTGCALIIFMVMLGGFTRLTNSGLSMVEWSLTGSSPPSDEQEWNELFNKYKLSPEARIINRSFSLPDFKRIFWLEYIHRFFGRMIGIVFIIPFIFFLTQKCFTKKLFISLLILPALGFAQGLAGWYMVKSGLAQEPHVSHYRLAFHLFNAYILFAFTLWLVIRVKAGKMHSVGKLPVLLIVMTVMFIIQSVYGALTAGLKSGYAYPTWPMMGGEWLPTEASSLRPLIYNFFGNGAMVQFVHRVIALIFLFLSIVTTWKFSKLSNKSTEIVTGVRLFALAVSVQFLLGVMAVLSGMSPVLAVLHQANSFFLLGTLIYLAYYFRFGPVSGSGS